MEYISYGWRVVRVVLSESIWAGGEVILWGTPTFSLFLCAHRVSFVFGDATQTETTRLRFYRISIEISVKFIHKGPNGEKTTVGQIMAWHRTANELVSELILVYFSHAYMHHQTSVNQKVARVCTRKIMLALSWQFQTSASFLMGLVVSIWIRCKSFMKSSFWINGHGMAVADIFCRVIEF